MMNALDRNPEGPALVHYGDGEFTVMRAGRFVLCAISGAQIPLETLRYWHPGLQEAYAGPQEALQRWTELSHDAA